MKDLHVYCIPLERLGNIEAKHSVDGVGQGGYGDVARMRLDKCGAWHNRVGADIGAGQRQGRADLRGGTSKNTQRLE